MELTASLKALFTDTAQQLRGSARRLFMARTVRELGPGGSSVAERELGWNQGTVRTGMHELTSRITGVGAFGLRGRTPVTTHLPHLLAAIRGIVDSQSQAGPQFRSRRWYTRLRAAEVRRRLIAQQGYTDAQVPTRETIARTRNALGCSRKRVAKTQPQKRSRRPAPSSNR